MDTQPDTLRVADKRCQQLELAVGILSVLVVLLLISLINLSRDNASMEKRLQDIEVRYPSLRQGLPDPI